MIDYKPKSQYPTDGKAICSNDGAYASEEIQGNRAATHTANHESLAPIYIHDISLVLDKEDVSKLALPPVPGYLHGLCPCRFCVPDDIIGI